MKADVSEEWDDLNEEEISIDSRVKGQYSEDNDDNSSWDYFESALSRVGYGSFQIRVLVICGLGFALASLPPVVLKYHQATVVCDLNFTSNEVWLSNLSSILGILMASVGWGLLLDLQGRIFVFHIALIVNSIADLIVSSTSTALHFIIARFFISISTCGITVASITLLAEYQMGQNRGFSLASLQIFLGITATFLPASGFEWHTCFFIGSTIAFLLAIYLKRIPESPRCLLSLKHWKYAFIVLQKMYCINTGDIPQSYSMEYLRENETLEEMKSRECPVYIPSYMCPRRCSLALVMLMQLIIMYSHGVLQNWHPSLSAHSDFLLPFALLNGSYFQVCSPWRQLPSSGFICDDAVDGFSGNLQHTLALGHFSLAAAIMVCFSNNYLGRKVLAGGSQTLIGFGVAFSGITSSLSVGLVIDCLLEAAFTVSITTAHCLASELSATPFRGRSIVAVHLSGLIGLVLGTLGVGFNVYYSCENILMPLAFVVAASGLLVFLLPNTTCTPLR